MNVIAKLAKRREKKRNERKRKKRLYKRTLNFDITTTTLINVYSQTHTLRQVCKKLSFAKPSINSTVKVHICTQNQIFEATLALSSTSKQEKETTTAFSPFSFFDEPIPATCQTLNLPESLFNQEAMDSLQYPTKLAASSDSVRKIVMIN